MTRKTKAQNIPALKNDGTWLLDGPSKSELFAKIWQEKNTLSPPGSSPPQLCFSNSRMSVFTPLRARFTLKCFVALKLGKATGADNLSNKFLKGLAKVLYVPFTKLCRRLLSTGTWPTCWKIHHLIPIYKRGSVFDAKNYRGVHLTSALSKIAEKVIGQPLLNYCIQERAFGMNQWAYQKNRSSKDLLTFLSCTWVIAFCSSRCIAAFFSDIEGAFDRVCTDFLIFKLWAGRWV